MSGVGFARRPNVKTGRHHQAPAKVPPKPVVHGLYTPHQPSGSTKKTPLPNSKPVQQTLHQTLDAKLTKHRVPTYDSQHGGEHGVARGNREENEAPADAAEPVGEQVERAARRKSSPLPTAAGLKGKRVADKDKEKAPPIIEGVPEAETGSVLLPREPLHAVEAGGSFAAPEDPEFQAKPRVGGKAEPVPPERERAIALFRDAVAAAARLYSALVADARSAFEGASASENQLEARGLKDLNAGLERLSQSLRTSRRQFDSAADTAAALVERRARETRRAIDRAANSAFATLASARRDADALFSEHDKGKTARGKTADEKVRSVNSAGASASGAINGLETSKEKDHPTTVEPMPSAVNEAIKLRLPARLEPSAKTYSEEADLESAMLTRVFEDMKTGLAAQYELIKIEMTKIDASSRASITSARDGAYERLAQTAAQLDDSITETRARGHAALVKQYNLSRRQMIAAHRDRARNESDAAQQRIMRGSNVALAAANGQQTAAQTLADNLAREKTRPAADFAKIIAGSSAAMIRHTDKAGTEQQLRARRIVQNDEARGLRQSEVTAARLAGSADEAAQQLDVAGETASKALTGQIEKSVESFAELPNPVRQALGPAMSAAKAGYAAQNGQAADKLKLAGETIAGAMAGESGGKTGAKEGGGVEGASGDSAKSPGEKPNEFVERAKKIAAEPNTDRSIAELIATAGREVPSKIWQKIGPLYDALQAFSTNVESVLSQLRAMTSLQGRALQSEYAKEKQPNLATHIRRELWKTFSSDETNRLNIRAALNYLAGNNVAAALAELKATVNWSNDEGRAEKVQRSLTPAQLDQLNTQHPDAMKAISDDLDGTDKAVFDALNKIKPIDKLQGKARADQEAINLAALGAANAYSLKKTIDDAREKRGEGGGDLVVDRLIATRESIGGDVLSGGDAVSAAFEDPEAARSRQDKLWGATEKGFADVVKKLPDGTPTAAAPGSQQSLSAITRYAAAARKYEVFVPNDAKGGGRHRKHRGGGRYKTVSEGLDPKQVQLIDDIVKHGPNSEEAAASTIEFELSRKGGKPKEDRLRKALLGDDLLAARERESDAKRALRLDDVKDASGKVIQQGDRSKVEARRKNILDKIAERRAAEALSADGSPVKVMDAKQVETVISSRLEERLAGDPTAKAYTKSMIASPTFEPDTGAAFDFALAHDEKNKETLAATLGRMNRSQVTEAVAKWDQASPKREPLYKQLGLFGNRSGKLDGDARNDTEMAFRGVARNDKERALNAVFVVEQQQRDSGAMGRTLAESDYGRMLAKQAKVLGHLGISRDDIDETGDIKLNGKDGKPITGKFDKDGQLELDPGDRDDFEAALQFSHMNAESYKQAVDRVATGVVMGLMVLAAVITTFVTFGGAAAIWGPILITAGAGLVGMGMTAAIRGDRYSKAEIQRDLVMTFVQAATAGLGAWAGAGAQGAGTAARGVQAAVKGAATSEKLAAQVAAAAGKQTLSTGAKAVNFGKEVVVGGATNSINSAVGAAMDPEHRRLGKSGEKALDSGINSFVGGALGAALTKPFSALGKSFGAGGQRVMGNVGSGFTSRLTEARMHHVAGDAHQSWAESLETAKEGVAQDAIQAFGEHHADGLAHKRASKKLRAAAATGGQQNRHKVPVSNLGEAPVKLLPEHVAREPQPSATAKTVGPEARAAMVVEALPAELKPTVDAATAPATETALKSPTVETVTPPFMPQSAIDAAPRHGEDVVAHKIGGETEQPTSIAANDNDGAKPQLTEPILARSALQNSGMLEMGAIPNHSVFVHPDPGDLMAANDNFGSLILHDPTREVAHIYNLDTGESLVVQGNKSRVGTINARGKQTGNGVPDAYGWTALLNGRADGRWVLRSHFHPNAPGSATTSLDNRLPSGAKGDFKVLLNEVRGHGLDSRSSRIYFIDDGHFNYTDFGIDAHSVDGRYWFEYPDPATGKRIREQFPTLRDYHTFVGHITGVYYPVPTSFIEPVLGKSVVQASSASAAGDGSPQTIAGDTGALHPNALTHATPASPATGTDASTISVMHDDGPNAAAKLPDDAPSPRDVSSHTDTLHAPENGHQQKAPTGPGAADINAVADQLKAGMESDAHAVVRSMGLVGEPDSMARLHRLINDATIDIPTRKAVAEAVLEATRQRMIAAEQLRPDEPLHMMFHGAPKDRTESLKAIGIDPTKLAHGPEEDYSGGLYMSKQLENALIYAHRFKGNEGDVFPFFVKDSDLGTVIDVAPGGTHRILWERFVMAHLSGYGDRISVAPTKFDMETRKLAFGTMNAFGNRGVVFDLFLQSLGGKFTKPDIVFGELGGLFTSGHGAGDQQTIKSHELATKLNKQLGFSGTSPDADVVPHKIDEPTEDSLSGHAPQSEADKRSERNRRAASADPSADGDPEAASPTSADTAQTESLIGPRRKAAKTAALPTETGTPEQTASPIGADAVVPKSGKTIFDGDIASPRKKEWKYQKWKLAKLKNDKDVMAARSIVAASVESRTSETEQAPQPPKKLAAVLARMQTKLQQEAKRDGRQITPEDRLKALRDILHSHHQTRDPELHRLLESTERDLQHTVVVEKAQRLVDEANKRENEQERKFRTAGHAKRNASRLVKELRVGTGKNYLKVKSNAKHDAILGPERFNQQQEIASSGPAGRRIGISTNHLIPLGAITNMPQFQPLYGIFLLGSTSLQAEIVRALQDLGDLPENLVPMRSDANRDLKRQFSWHAIDPKDAAQYGYTPDDVRIMRDREDKMHAAILLHIEKITKAFQAKLAVEAANMLNNALLGELPRFSTANPEKWQSAVPRNLAEQALFNNVLDNPQFGMNLPDMNSDERFRGDAGWQKMEDVIRTLNGDVSVHYQYNAASGIVMDVKVVSQPLSIK